MTGPRATFDRSTGRFALRASWQEITDAVGGLTDDDFRDGFMHLVDVAYQNHETNPHGPDLVANAIPGAPAASPLPDEIRRDMAALFTEAMAVGKEITLRKLARVFDPNGEFIDVPAEWIGKGPGVAS